MNKYSGPFSQSGYNEYAFDILLVNLWFFLCKDNIKTVKTKIA